MANQAALYLVFGRREADLLRLDPTKLGSEQSRGGEP